MRNFFAVIAVMTNQARFAAVRNGRFGGGVGSAWLRAGSAIGPILVGFIVGDFGIRYVFAVFAAVAVTEEAQVTQRAEALIFPGRQARLTPQTQPRLPFHLT